MSFVGWKVRAAAAMLATLVIGGCAASGAGEEDGEDAGESRASNLSATQRKERAAHLRDVSASRGITKGWLLAGIANAETNTRQGADLRKEFPPGKEVTAKVTESTDRRVRLSIKAAHDDAERADFDTYRSEVAGKSGMGTLADLLKRKMKKA